jgi:hypothetical protein
MTKGHFKVTYDDGREETATVNELFAWGKWSWRECAQLDAVLNGDLRRLSTDRDGAPCDIEAAPED